MSKRTEFSTDYGLSTPDQRAQERRRKAAEEAAENAMNGQMQNQDGGTTNVGGMNLRLNPAQQQRYLDDLHTNSKLALDLHDRNVGIANTMQNYGGRLLSSGVDGLLKYAETSVDEAAQEAGQEVNGAFSRTIDSNNRNLSRMGVNPNSGRFASSNTDMALARAAAEAGARNEARINARQRNFSNFGQITQMGNSQFGLALSALN